MENFLPATAILIALALGAITFYIFEFLAKKKLADFSIKKWLSDNWLKILILSPIVLLIDVKYIDPGMTEQSAFWAGAGVSMLIDRIQDMIMKPKTS